jgi:4-amino-4-deoxy-L-arabinose transferase-like glycosyltransferase
MVLSRASPSVVVLALMPIWLLGLFGRGYWTPDEPREADIAWRMMTQPDKSIPEMAGQPFAEKPPLAYWLSAASMSVLGPGAAAARVPNLIYAIACVLAVAALARAIAGGLAALIAGVAAGSFLLAYQVSIWLATDAPLVAGVALALLGLYRGFTSDRGRQKATWYTLMHVGMLVGFLAKSAIGWMVPACALLVLIAWERRWRELASWELYAGMLLQIVVIGYWVWTVTQRSDGLEQLEVMFWYNLAGRFITLPAAAPLQYTNAHHNWFGKYLLQAPGFLAPWTLLAVAAGRHAWRRIRHGGVEALPWKFVAAAILPLLLLLSVSATARGIYLAPILPSVGLMIGLWASERLDTPDATELWLLRATIWLMIGIVALLTLSLSIIAVAVWPTGHLDPWRAAAAVTGCFGAAALSVRALRRMTAPVALSALEPLYGAFAVLLVGIGLFLMPLINTSQDLRSIATRVRELAGAGRLALYQPDETTVAMFDYDTSAPRPAAISDADENSALSKAADLAQREPTLRWLVQFPTHASGPVSDELRRLHGVARPRDAFWPESIARMSDALGLKTLAVIELPEGRRYALLGAAIGQRDSTRRLVGACHRSHRHHNRTGRCPTGHFLELVTP